MKFEVTLTQELSKEIEADSKTDAINSFSEIDAQTRQLSFKARRIIECPACNHRLTNPQRIIKDRDGSHYSCPKCTTHFD